MAEAPCRDPRACGRPAASRPASGGWRAVLRRRSGTGWSSSGRGSSPLMVVLATLRQRGRALRPDRDEGDGCPQAALARITFRDRPVRSGRAEPDHLREPHRPRGGALEHRDGPGDRIGALGLVGGFLGGWTDLAIGRIMDVLFSFPTLVLAIAIAAMLGPGLNNAVLAIAVVYAPLFCRVARGPVIAERAKEHVAAAIGLGAGCSPDHLPPHPAQCPRAADRAGLGGARLRDPDRGLAELPRPRDAAAGPVMGHHAERGPDLPRDRAVDEHLPRASRSCWPSSGSTCWATASATCSTRSSAAASRLGRPAS